jgi:RNA polymerase sigma-70 factor (ECF subfamily)
MKEIINLSDEKLVDLVRNQDQELYTYIVKRYQEKLLRYANYLVSDDQTSQDIVQTAFVKAFQNLKGFNPKKKFSSWIYRIVHNESINALKKNHKLVNLKADHWHQISSDQNIEAEFDTKQTKEMVKKSLDKLPMKYKAPMTLFYLQDKSYEDTSDILKTPIGTIGTRINRGKKLLKTIIQERDL